jgi:hypothetical protein
MKKYSNGKETQFQIISKRIVYCVGRTARNIETSNGAATLQTKSILRIEVFKEVNLAESPILATTTQSFSRDIELPMLASRSVADIKTRSAKEKPAATETGAPGVSGWIL